MPSHQDNLAAVRAACVAASGKNPTEGCICSPVVVCASHAALERFDPTLPDVLLALAWHGKKFVVLQAVNVADVYIAKQRVKKLNALCLWNLRLPLSGQSEEAVASLAALLKAND